MIKPPWLPRVWWHVTDPRLGSRSPEPIRSAFSSVHTHLHTFRNIHNNREEKAPTFPNHLASHQQTIKTRCRSVLLACKRATVKRTDAPPRAKRPQHIRLPTLIFPRSNVSIAKAGPTSLPAPEDLHTEGWKTSQANL